MVTYINSVHLGPTCNYSMSKSNLRLTTFGISFSSS